MNSSSSTDHYIINGSSTAAGQLGDTTLTKVFVGGLAWETPKEALRDHFDKYGEILEAVIISNKLSGRSKGYGFVTFKEAEAASKACEDATPVINGRRANCNLASLGARRTPRSSTHVPAAATPNNCQRNHHRQHGSNVVGGATSANNNYQRQQVQWYYPATSPSSPHHHQHIPFYGYCPVYIGTDMTNNNQKLSYGSSTSYMAHVMPAQMYNQAVYPAALFYHQYHSMGLPSAAAHIYSPSFGRSAIVSKPASMVAPPPSSGGGRGSTVGGAVEKL